MSHFVIVYSRPTGNVSVEDLGADRQAALRRSFQLEVQERGNPNVEVVVLSAASLEALERTHSRYFNSFDKITSSAQDSIKP